MYFQNHQATAPPVMEESAANYSEFQQKNPQHNNTISEKELYELQKIKRLLQSQSDAKQSMKKHSNFLSDDRDDNYNERIQQHENISSQKSHKRYDHENKMNSNYYKQWLLSQTNSSKQHTDSNQPSQQLHPLTRTDVIAIGFFLGLFGVIAIVALVMALQEKSTIATALNLGYKIIRDKQNSSGEDHLDPVKEVKKEQHLTAFQELKNQAIDQLGGIAKEFVARHLK